MAIMRFDPFAETGLDRLMDRMLAGTPAGTRSVAAPMDVYRRGQEYVVEIDLPGVGEDAIEVNVERNLLSVTAERGAEHREGDEELVCERPHAAVMRQLYLGENLDTEHIEANLDRGVLTLHIPMAPETQARRIEVSGAAGERSGRTIDVDAGQVADGQEQPAEG